MSLEIYLLTLLSSLAGTRECSLRKPTVARKTSSGSSDPRFHEPCVRTQLSMSSISDRAKLAIKEYDNVLMLTKRHATESGSGTRMRMMGMRTTTITEASTPMGLKAAIATLPTPP